MAKSYGILIAGKQVTDKNADSICGEGISGRVSYNPETNTLYLDHATIYAKTANAIFCYQDVNIEVIGKNVLNTEQNTSSAFYLAASEKEDTIRVRISGDTLIAQGMVNKCGGLSLSGCMLTLSGGVVFKALSSGSLRNGISVSSRGGYSKITVDSSTLVAKGADDDLSVSTGFDFEMTNAFFKAPAHTIYNSEKKTFTDTAGNTIKDTIIIVPVGKPESVARVSSLSCSLYPNPATDVLNITSGSVIREVEIFNVAGVRMNSVYVRDNNAALNIGSLSSGVYFVRVRMEDGLSVKKLIKK